MPFDLSTGFVVETFDEIFQLYQQAARDSLGDDVDLGPESPLGQLLGAFAARDVQIQERILALSNGLSRQRAVGYQLDDLYSIFGIYRNNATRSTVTATLGGAATTVVPAGSRAATRTGAHFRLQADATIGTGGTVDATMEAVDTGATAVAIGELDRIVDLVPGWETVTNAAAATTGRDREPTPTFRTRASRETDTNATGTHRSIISAIYEAGADDVIVEANNTSTDVTRRGSTILARGVLVVASGGTNAAIANAIVNTVAAGISTGTGTVTVTTDFGDVQFSRPIDVTANVAINIAIDADLFPGDGLTRIRNAVVEYVNGLRIGAHADANRVIIAIYSAVPAGSAIVNSTPTLLDGSSNDLTVQANVDLVDRIRTAASSVAITTT